MTEADETYIPRSVVTSSGSHPDILGDYRLMEKLGQGGMGAVYRAEHTRLGKQVAVKLLPEESTADPAAVARFQREMKAVGQLQHPNIIQALDAREEGGFHFLVMELVEGIELDDLRKTIGPIRLSDAADIIVQAANGLQHAHEQGLVHRDIKPSNLLLSAEGIVKVLDLGLAVMVNGERAMSDNLTVTGQVMGTLDYMAPEQADDTHGVDIRADIYSLGCTFFALLAGKPPFDGAKYTTPVRKITAHMTRQAPSILKRRRDVPPEAARILNRMLAKKPADRFQSPAEVVEALQPLTAKSNLPKLAKKTALKIAQANKKENPDLTGQETNPQASAGPSTANRIEEPSTEADAAGAGPPDITDGKVPGNAVPADRADNGTQTVPADLDAAVNSIIVDPPTYADQRAGHKASRRSFSDRGKVPRSLWISLGLAAFVVLLSVIIIKIKDKNGNVVATIEVPEGGSVEIGEDSPAKASGGRESPDGTANPLDSSTKRPDRNPELNHRADAHRSPDVEEPPPLEEWLKGRKILTVKQDGTADFTTIQAALDAAGPGKVVKILDDGPYVERLAIRNLKDGGLIGNGKSRIEPKDYESAEVNGEPFLIAHQATGNCGGLRISGIVFNFRDPNWIRGLQINDGATIDNCGFHFTPAVKGSNQAFLVDKQRDRWTAPLIVTNCIFDAGRLQAHAKWLDKTSRILVRRNFFRGCKGTYTCLPVTSGFGQLMCEENIFVGPCQHAVCIVNHAGERRTANYHFLNNTFTDAYQGLVASYHAATDGVILRSCLFTSEPFYPQEGSEDHLSGWSLRHNWFLTNPNADGSNSGGPLEFLSTDPMARNFLRLPANSPAATAGAGSKFPQHAGALPPGPAPSEGDWFTRILDRWREAQRSQHSPSDEPRGDDSQSGGKSRPEMTSGTESEISNSKSEILEPPPLEEWLKGRKILTVKQDGTADFKTIQAALDALKDGQVVEVLDQGPYVEHLSLIGRHDVGIISRVGSVVRLEEWSPNKYAEERQLLGMSVGICRNVRLSGLIVECIIDRTSSNFALHLHDIPNVCIEECVFASRVASDIAKSTAPSIQLVPGSDEPSDVAIIRDCVFDDVAVSTVAPRHKSSFAIRRCLFYADANIHSLSAHFTNLPDAASTVVVEHNIFCAVGNARSPISPRYQGRATDDSWNKFVCRNNTVFTELGVPSAALFLFGVFENVDWSQNLMLGSPRCSLSSGAEMQLGTVTKKWYIADNAVAKDWTDRTELSLRNAHELDLSSIETDVLKPNGFRIPSDGPLATRGSRRPQYIGALPPGPAPQEGDWFTRILDRWREAQRRQHSPSDEPRGDDSQSGVKSRPEMTPETESEISNCKSEIPEPSPLEKYLKGRKILTVKQDGTADFKTIQAALDALKPGQVVEVLDKGPYVENLEVTSNQDGGLISRVQTQIAPTQWKEMEDGAKAAFLFKSSSDFRISGLSFDAPGPLSEKSQVVYISTKGSVTFEDCRLKQFGDHYSDKTPTIGALLVANDGAGIHVRGCNIIGSLQAATYSPDSLIVVEKNWIHGHASAGLSIQAGRRGQTTIAKNIIATTRPVAIFVAQSDATDANTSVVQDNTLISDVESIRVERHAHQALILEGNILNRPMTSHDADDKSRELPSHWRIKDNIWPADARHRLALAPPKSAVLMDVEFLSTKHTSRNYMRVRPDASTLAWASFPKRFPGALPPGPAPPAGDWFTRLQQRWQEAAEVSDDVAKTPGQATVRDLVLEALTLKAQRVRVGVGGGRVVDVSSPEQIPNYEYHIVGVRFFQTSTLTDDQVMSWLKRVPQIQSLQFDYCANITDGVLSFVGEQDFPVTDLTLVNTKCTVEGLLRFLRNRAVRHLKVSGELFDPAVAAAISTNEGLTGVIVNNGDPKDWEQLCTLPNAAQLSTIGLSGATLSAEEWQQLQTFENAETFYFTSSNIADRDLSTLQQLEKLQRLSLGNTKVTDVGLKTLSEIKTLRYLEIHHTKVTLEGLKELQRAIPQCQIIWDEGTLAPVSQE